jgi:TRAP-type transport system periplasmic protein
VPAALTAALVALLVGCGSSGGDKAGGKDEADATPARYRDAVGEVGTQPDIQTIEVTSTPDGQISFRVTLAHLTARSKTGVDLWLDTDANPETGNTTFDDAGGAEFLFSAFPPDRCGGGALRSGDGCLARFSPGTWVAATARTGRVSRTANGYMLSINRSDLGDTDEFNFYAIYGVTDGITERAPGTGTFNYSLRLGGPRTDASLPTVEQADKAGGQPEGTPVVLTLANHDYASFDSAPAQFAAAVKRISGGSIDIKIRYGFRYYDVDEKGTIADVRSGTIDAALVGARAWDTVGVRSFQALLAPFLVDSYPLERRVLESELVDPMLDGIEPLGLVGLAIVPGELRRPLGTSRALLRPEDYEGALIGIRPSSLSRTTFEALGGSAKGFAGPDALAGFDGAESGVHTIQGNGYDVGARALTANVVLWPRPATIVMNEKVFDALTDDQQDALRRAGVDTVEPLLATIEETEQSALEAICQGSHLPLLSASPADRTALRRAVQPVYDRIERDPLTQELISEIEDLRANEIGAADEPLRCPKALPAGDEEALQGLWRVTVTRKELRAAGAQLEQLERAEGSWTLELHDGRWVGRNLDSGNIYRGTYTVNGDVLRDTTRSCNPTNICTPGNVEEYTWSVYRDRLELAPIPGRLFNMAAIAKPFSRAR